MAGGMHEGWGVRRDGWYGLGLGYDKLLSKGTPAQAVIKHLYFMHDSDDSIASDLGIGNERPDFHARGAPRRPRAVRRGKACSRSRCSCSAVSPKE